MSDNSIARVHYFEGQFLRTQDFVDEQAYHVAMRRRHNISHHTWGIVSGLELVLEEGNFSVQPGMAVDGYGRELILPQKKGLSAAAFIDKGSNELDVWLIYGLKSSDEAAAGYAGCGDSDRTSASFYRWQETAQLLLSKPDLDSPRRMPKEVPAADANFSPTRTPPDNPELSWPVFLGQIINDPTNQQQPLTVKSDDRPYVGLVGEEITAASGRARVQVGIDPVQGSLRRFGVFTRNQNADPRAPRWLSRFEIDAEGELTVQGNANVQGNLVVNGGAVELITGPERDTAAPAWNIYHVTQGNVEELRIEMAATRATGIASNRVVIGAWFKGPDETGQEKEEFHPCLTVHDDCTVEVSGNLVVKGIITAKEIVGGRLSDAARNAAASAIASGILTTSARLPALPQVAPPPPNLSLAPLAIASVDNLVDRIENDEVFRKEFVEKMKNSTVLNVSPAKP